MRPAARFGFGLLALVCFLSSCGIAPQSVVPRVITERLQRIDRLYWSPDHTQIAFSYVNYAAIQSQSPFHNHVFVMRADGSQLREIYHDISNGIHLLYGWTQDGSGLVIARAPGRVNPSQADEQSLIDEKGNEWLDELAQGGSITLSSLRLDGRQVPMAPAWKPASLKASCLLMAEGQQYLLWLTSAQQVMSLHLSPSDQPAQTVSLESSSSSPDAHRQPELLCSQSSPSLLFSVANGAESSQAARFASGQFKAAPPRLEAIKPLPDIPDFRSFNFLAWRTPTRFVYVVFSDASKPNQTTSVQEYDLAAQQSRSLASFSGAQSIHAVDGDWIIFEDAEKNLNRFNLETQARQLLLNKNKDLPLGQAAIIAS